MPKAEIGWTRRNDEGEKLQVYVQHVGKEWRFHVRQRRFENWEPVEHPLLEDWLALLDAVSRRVSRRLLKPEELHRVRQSIRELFPEQDI